MLWIFFLVTRVCVCVCVCVCISFWWETCRFEFISATDLDLQVRVCFQFWSRIPLNRWMSVQTVSPPHSARAIQIINTPMYEEKWRTLRGWKEDTAADDFCWRISESLTPTQTHFPKEEGKKEKETPNRWGPILYIHTHVRHLSFPFLVNLN